MRRLISGATYFFAISAVILILLGLAVNFSSKVFEIFPQDPKPVPAKTQTENTTEIITEKITEEETAVDVQATSDNSPVYEIPVVDNVINAEAIVYEGDLELPIKGATGFATVELDVFDNNISEILTALQPGDAFVILDEKESWWQIYIPEINIIGYVRHNSCMINLPDVIPSIIYDNTNAYSSLFTANDYYIPNITGYQLYSYSKRADGKVYNERLDKYEYIVPVLYAMSKKICKAQAAALKNGDTLGIIEGFRPYSVQNQVYKAVASLASYEPGVKKGFGNWNMTWFIASGISNHQIGFAIDTTLYKVTQTELKSSGKYKFIQTKGAFYAMPSEIHDLSSRAIIYTKPNGNVLSESMSNNEPALKLQKYCMDSGLNPLASEWWHFNDDETANNLIKKGDGNYQITECLSKIPD